MVQDIQTSFIPKKSVEEVRKKRRTTGVGLVTLIAFIIFIISLAATGSVFLYERFLTGAIQSKGADLERARAAFEPETIEDLSRIDEKLETGRRVLSEHIALSGLFELLENLTLKNVQFTGLELEETVDGIVARLTGEAESFAAVALQSDSFGGERHLRNVIFSDVNVISTGAVSFDLAFTLDPEYFSYEASLARQ
jgi:hypothetical protein